MTGELFDLRGKVAIVTGGNGGIGLGIAKGLAAANAGVAVAARNEDKTASAVQELRTLGSDATGASIDVSDEDSIKAAVAETVDRYGRLDILVNNAGTTVRSRPEDYEAADWDLVQDVNLRGAFLCCREVYPHMVRQGGGKIINIGSMTSIFGLDWGRALRCQQGWNRPALEEPRHRLGKGQHPGQRDPARLDIDRPDGPTARAVSRKACANHVENTRRTLGRPIGLRGRSGIPGHQCVGLRHRNGDPRRRRVLRVLGANFDHRAFLLGRNRVGRTNSDEGCVTCGGRSSAP